MRRARDARRQPFAGCRVRVGAWHPRAARRTGEPRVVQIPGRHRLHLAGEPVPDAVVPREADGHRRVNQNLASVSRLRPVRVLPTSEGRPAKPAEYDHVQWADPLPPVPNLERVLRAAMSTKRRTASWRAPGTGWLFSGFRPIRRSRRSVGERRNPPATESAGKLVRVVQLVAPPSRRASPPCVLQRSFPRRFMAVHEVSKITTEREKPSNR